MLNRILKPKWQHKDPVIRQRAVAEVSDEATLIKIANSDDVTEVREAAIQRIPCIATLQKISPHPKLEATLNQRFEKLLNKEAAQLAFHPIVAERLQRINSTELNKVIADQAGDMQLRKAALALIPDNEQALLAHYSLTDPSAEIRYAMAQRLHEEALIRDTLKRLGKKDKRVIQTLRNHLDTLEANQSQMALIKELIESVEQIGHSEQWQRDQTQLNTLRNRWSKLSNVNPETGSQFSRSCGNASERLEQWRKKLQALRPLIKAKESQCTLAEDFLQQLEQRQRLSEFEARELDETLDIFHQDWDQLDILPEQYEPDLANRFHQALKRLHERISFLQRNSRLTEGLERIIRKTERQLQQPHIPAGFIEKLRADWEKQKQPEDPHLAEEYQIQFAGLCDRLKAQLAKQKQHQEKSLNSIQAWLDRIETSLAQDQLNDSDLLQKKIKQTLGQLVNLPKQDKRSIENRLQKVLPRIQELKGWRHWGTDQARKDLINEAVDLSETDQDPNTRAAAVRELRSRWKKLGKIDPASGHKLWKDFDTACTSAYALCQAHFDAEDELRQRNLQLRENICNEFEALERNTNWDSPDWRALDKQARKLQNRWRKSDPVNRRDWQTILKRYKLAEAAIESQLINERRVNHSKREALIEKLEVFRNHENLAEAMQIAREAQRAWQPTVTGRRSDEQKLWKRFRAAADAIFDRDKEKQETARHEFHAKLDKKKALCVAAEELANSAPTSANDISRLRQQWDKTPPLKDKHKDKQTSALERRFEQAIRSIKKASQKGHWKQQLKQLYQLMEKHDLLETLEKAIQRDSDDGLINSCKKQWISMTNGKDRSSLQQRFEKAGQGTFDANELETNAESRASLLLDLEILLELKSPPELAEKRMQKQVDRLASAMGHKDEHGRQLESSLERIRTYFEAGAVPPDLAEKFGSRLIPVVAKLEHGLARLIGD